MYTFSILKLTDENRWIDELNSFESKDIVHSPAYMRVFELEEEGVGECFIFNSDLGKIMFPYLRRPIPYSEVYTDLATPYGYGGPILISERNDEHKLVKEFCTAFDTYARDTNTVSQFIRFHPFLQNQNIFIDVWDGITLHSNNAMVVLDCAGDGAVKMSPRRKSFRTLVNKAEQHNLVTHQILEAKWAVEFFGLYRRSMDRKNAHNALRFSEDFFVKLFRELGTHAKWFAVKRGEEICAASICLSHGRYLDYFLSTSDPRTLHLSPNHIMISDICKWGVNNGVRNFHLGGGSKSLAFFKNGFANSNVEFFVGRRIFNSSVYKKITKDHYDRNKIDEDDVDLWFPSYRKVFV